MPFIKEAQMAEPTALSLPHQLKKESLAESCLSVRPLYANERLSSSDSLPDRADECPGAEATPSEGGDSTADSWADEQFPASARMPPTPTTATTGSGYKFNVDAEAEAHSAIQALLSLQREPSPGIRMDFSRAGSDSAYTAARAPSHGLLHGGITKSDPSIRFYCRFPRCGKGYASTDAVRKHCRQRHLEWLRRLGHGCPALYCRWDE